MKLEAAHLDRAAGVLVAQACGDALGVPYEFSAPPPGEPEMKGGGLGPYAPGEYSDDTQMAVCIAEVAAKGVDLTSDDALDEIAELFLEWHEKGASDVGVQTRWVLSEARNGAGRPADRLRDASRRLHERTGRTAGNGALMRTGVVGLVALDNPEQTAEAARAIAELTHADPLAAESCILWSVGVAIAVKEGTFEGVRMGLDYLPPDSRDYWAARLKEAEEGPPGLFTPNGFTVRALQAAYASICATPVPPDNPASGSFPCAHLQRSLMTAIRIGDDTDTVAAIGGALLGARWGLSAIPARWRRFIHGWPGLRSSDLMRLGLLAARGGETDAQGWPAVFHMHHNVDAALAIPHPADHAVILGTAKSGNADLNAIVSLCRMGRGEISAPGVNPEDHVQFWLIDGDEEDNPNLVFVIDDAARTVCALRREGRRVLLHCVWCESRTPTVAARYGMLLGASADDAKLQVSEALGFEPGNRQLWSALDQFDVSLGSNNAE